MFKCNCGAQYVHQNDYRYHLREHHPAPNTFQCHHCIPQIVSFCWPEEFEAHMTIFHPDVVRESDGLQERIDKLIRTLNKCKKLIESSSGEVPDKKKVTFCGF